MPDTNKPNPNYVNAPFEMSEWTPAHGMVLWKEVCRDKDTVYLEGTTEDGAKLARQWRYIPDTGVFKPADWKGERKFHRCEHLESLTDEIESLKLELRSVRADRAALYSERDKLRKEVQRLDEGFFKAKRESEELRADVADLAAVKSPEPRQEPTIQLKGGTVLTLRQTGEALEAAMYIIESVGTTGIYEKCGFAAKWMKRYFPNWA